MKSDYQIVSMRHSLAHIMAAVIANMWPEAQFGIGPTTDDGFYYDVSIPNYLLSETDLLTIEKEMDRFIKADIPFEQYKLPIDEAIEWAKTNHQPYKEELLNDLKRSGTTSAKDIRPEEMGIESKGDSKISEVSFYRCGDFVDLCRGPHVKSTSNIGSFKLIRVSGAYWRGDVHKDQLQRLYGVAFASDKELDEYLESTEQAKIRDHRKIGKELDLFVVSDLIGPGLPLFTPRGTVLRDQLIAFSEELQIAAGYERVWAPHIARLDLYRKSGHLDKYPERFEIKSVESDDVFMLKPMNCPHVVQIFGSRPRSYRDMPQRYMETTTMYRDEKSGELHGLSRVRSLTQDDSHAFVRKDQVENEFRLILSMIKQMYLTLDMPLSVDLSFRDESDNYFGDKEQWKEAEDTIERLAKEENMDYRIIRGEAAFYGPKIDIHVSDALGRKWQCATVQLDYVMPQRFGLSYTDKDGSSKSPIIVHKAILGSIERFLAVYIEHTAGRFPVWLAPEQIRLISLNSDENIIDYANEIISKAKKLGLRIGLDSANETVGKKIRDCESYKVPYSIVIGNKELEKGQVIPRIRSDLVVRDRKEFISIDEFLNTVSKEVESRANRSTL